ncbi:MAG: SDR family oxidoreductase [Candidatus Marinimicrobia bacterium]|nr:SDR family oxidoreductase [Candidatus Neomarinimicrobiota bacterium]
MKTLILGASGVTGSLVALELLSRKIPIRVIVRESATLPAELFTNPLVEIRRGNITEIADSELLELLENCDSVISCLGHNITLKGMVGQPRNLVATSIRNICNMINRNIDSTVKLILMSTTAYTNTKDSEKNSWGEYIILSILHFILPPHRDNVSAANYLQNEIGTENPKIEWIAVRPDTLINESEKDVYEVHQSPVRSPIFDAGKISRINVGQFMADLLTSKQLWHRWRYQMPVIYNQVLGE